MAKTLRTVGILPPNGEKVKDETRRCCTKNRMVIKYFPNGYIKGTMEVRPWNSRRALAGGCARLCGSGD